ncbi:hypothetical protein HCH_00088 [Hahella chejuensis KCTC 2396]|uniref:Uncharacterized protein n=1 Tax=Hahella chejuensis (strain KCTC 2396) TaxID=349521 RepID=Q2SQR5_HAHCH|nr:hypothetical protein HCH_00088 [Hahella chejuensis KCTC 2396]
MNYPHLARFFSLIGRLPIDTEITDRPLLSDYLPMPIKALSLNSCTFENVFKFVAKNTQIEGL